MTSRNDTVDVLIIGSGASGAAVAWSLAETRMKILCLEQGDWMKHSDFPSNGRDWEARRFADFDVSPNRRGRDTDYPVNDDNSLMKVANFNGVGGIGGWRGGPPGSPAKPETPIMRSFSAKNGSSAQ